MKTCPKSSKISIISIIVFVFSLTQGGATMKIISPDFQNNQLMPAKVTCDGKNISPPLVIEGIPDGTKTLALIMDDPDAVSGTFVHWVVFDIPVTSRIEADSIPGKQGNNTAGRRQYHGPCPPSGTHRYFFKIYALDTVLNSKEGITKAQLEQSMQSHILDKAELIGLYKRNRY